MWRPCPVTHTGDIIIPIIKNDAHLKQRKEMVRGQAAQITHYSKQAKVLMYAVRCTGNL